MYDFFEYLFADFEVPKMPARLEENGFERDRENLRGDWLRVCGDFSRATEKMQEKAPTLKRKKVVRRRTK